MGPQISFGALFVVQDIPEFVEAHIGLGLFPLATAISLVPLAEETMEAHVLFGALVCVQVWAEVKPVVIKTAATEAHNIICVVFIVAFEELNAPWHNLCHTDFLDKIGFF